MGMYTGLRFKAKLKPFVAEAMSKLYEDKDCSDFWGTIARIIPISDAWLSKDRRNFIPFGAISYLPDDWDAEACIAGLKEAEWHVCCSLKNYNGEIELFLRDVLPTLISEICQVEYLYEEWSESNFDTIIPQQLEILDD